MENTGGFKLKLNAPAGVKNLRTYYRHGYHAPVQFSRCGVPAEAKCYRHVVGVSVAEEDTVITRLGEEFSAPPPAEFNPSARIHTRFVNRIRRQDLRGWHCHGIEKAEEGIVCGKGGDRGPGEFLRLAIESAPADQVNVERTLRMQVHDGVDGCREYVDVTIGKSDAVQRSAIDPEPVVS